MLCAIAQVLCAWYQHSCAKRSREKGYQLPWLHGLAEDYAGQGGGEQRVKPAKRQALVRNQENSYQYLHFEIWQL